VPLAASTTRDDRHDRRVAPSHRRLRLHLGTRADGDLAEQRDGDDDLDTKWVDLGELDDRGAPMPLSQVGGIGILGNFRPRAGGAPPAEKRASTECDRIPVRARKPLEGLAASVRRDDRQARGDGHPKPPDQLVQRALAATISNLTRAP
jgi:hypothetical protein